MKLKLEKREKGGLGKLRRDGKVPAVIYGLKGEAETVSIAADAFQAILSGLKPGALPTKVFELDLNGTFLKAIVKEIQYHVVNYSIKHIDFLKLSDETPVTVSVPIHLHGAADCAGVKLGGFLRQTIRSLKVRCLPKDMPEEFAINVTDLGVNGSVRLSEIAISDKITPLAQMNEVAVVVAKKAGT